MIAIAKEISKRPILRNRLLAIFCFMESIAIGVTIYGTYSENLNKEIIFEVGLVFSVLFFIVLVTVIISYLPALTEKTSINEKLTEIENKRTEIENKINQSNRGNVQEIIKLNLNQLDEYYTINKNQSKSSYRFSVAMILIGFVLIVVTVIVYFRSPNKYALSIITGLTGLLTEFIGATSLLLYRESTKHLNEFIERLTYLQKIMLAIDLAEKLPNKKKEKQISKIIEGLISKKNKTDEIQAKEKST